MTTAPLPTLYVLPPSHYCERARWALDFAAVDHVEVRWPVGLHVPLAKRIAASSTTPILAIGADVVQGSDRILDHVGMAGGDWEIEERFERRIGPLVRRFIYSATLHLPRSGIRQSLFEGVPARQRAMATLMWPVTRRLMQLAMKAHPGSTARLADDLEAELDWFDGRLDGRDYLVGDEFGRADLTAASLLAPLARPPEGPDYRRVVLPPEVEARVACWAERPSLRWVRRTYGRHRRRVGAASAVAAPG